MPKERNVMSNVLRGSLAARKKQKKKVLLFSPYLLVPRTLYGIGFLLNFFVNVATAFKK